MNKIPKKLMIFHPTIAPYRIDFFNDLYENFLTEIYLYYRNLKNQTFNYEEIEKKFLFMPHYMKKVVGFGEREIYKGSIKEILKVKPDVVMVGEYGFGPWSAVIARRLSHRKFRIISMCDDTEEIASGCRGLRKLSRNILMKYLDGLVLCSYNAERWYKKNFKINTFVFPIIRKEQDFRNELEKAIPLANEKIVKYDLVGKKVFIFVGRLSEEKNIEYLVKSFIKASKQYKDIRLFIIGEENSDRAQGIKGKIELLIKENQADEQIKLLGRLEGIELNAWYNIGQVLVLPSKYDRFGAVVNEALIAGQYAMVSKYAGASEVVNEENGEVIDIDKEYIDFTNILDKLNSLRENGNLRESKMICSYENFMAGLKEWINNMF